MYHIGYAATGTTAVRKAHSFQKKKEERLEKALVDSRDVIYMVRGVLYRLGKAKARYDLLIVRKSGQHAFGDKEGSTAISSIPQWLCFVSFLSFYRFTIFIISFFSFRNVVSCL